MKFLTLPLTKKKREREKEEQKQSNIKLLKIAPLVTNYHKLSLLPLVVRLSHKFEKQKLVLNFESCYYFISYVSIASTKDLNLLQISTEN